MACCHNIQDYTNIKDVISYLQGTIFSSVKTTILQAINNGNFAPWPGLTVENVNKHYKPTLATAQGHTSQNQQNTRSTQPKNPGEDIDATVAEDLSPTYILQERSNEVYTILT
jgi:hypothetical protein